ncbi:major facilitator superfamily MFS_1 [Clostridium sp. DL-VIII]|uniref:MFS transporter n=1 Tax=Clostridium sp. DL-VIII TaxID=641107 RepID=UPI00023AFA53|nr:MFS transporter [Clostridium sp. DL-VIII]EHI98767.1 major facilitator superfamily MFS_1 [Clostridium sp. DL-VIII]
MNTETKQIQTPYIRLVIAILIGQMGVVIAIVAPLYLLLAYKLTQIDPNKVTVNIGLVTSIAVLFALVGNPVGGAISDRTPFKFGRRRTWILIGDLLGSASLIGIAYATNVWMVLVFWCAAQAFLNFNMAALVALIADQVDEGKRGKASGIVSLSQMLGMFVAIALINAVTNSSLVVKFTLTAGISLLLTIICCVLIKEGKVVYQKPLSEKNSFSLMSIFPSPRKYPNFMWAWITRFFIMAANSYTVYNVVVFAQRYDLTEAQITEKMLIQTLVSSIFAVVSSALGGFLSDKFRKQRLFVFSSAFVVAIGLAIMAFSNNFEGFLLGVAIAGFGQGIYFAVDLALNTRILPSKENSAKDLGLINIAATLPQSLVPLFAPLILERFGFVGFFLLFSAFAILSGLTVMPIPEMPAKDEEEKLLRETTVI